MNDRINDKTSKLRKTSTGGNLNIRESRCYGAPGCSIAVRVLNIRSVNLEEGYVNTRLSVYNRNTGYVYEKKKGYKLLLDNIDHWVDVTEECK